MRAKAFYMTLNRLLDERQRFLARLSSSRRTSVKRLLATGWNCLGWGRRLGNTLKYSRRDILRVPSLDRVQASKYRCRI